LRWRRTRRINHPTGGAPTLKLSFLDVSEEEDFQFPSCSAGGRRRRIEALWEGTGTVVNEMNADGEGDGCGPPVDTERRGMDRRTLGRGFRA
jgi:hypothetical protein